MLSLLVLWTGLVPGSIVNTAEKYTPTFEPCPAQKPLVRIVGPDPGAQTLSRREQRYVKRKRARVLPGAWAAYATAVDGAAPGSLPAYVGAILRGAHGRRALPRLGLAASGGALRAALFGAGVLGALDGRNATSVRAGLGGLLQAATYISGLSGGSWLVLSLAQANFPMLPALVSGALPAGRNRHRTYGGWITEVDLLDPLVDPDTPTPLLDVLIEEVAQKAASGFPVTISDVWGRSLARHYVNETTAGDVFEHRLKHGAGITLHSLAHLPSFRDFTQPFPIVIANSITPGPNTSVILDEPAVAVPLANPIYEFNVYETGSFDPSLGAFIPTKFLGSRDGTNCTRKFDQLSLIQGISSSLFNVLNTSDTALLHSTVGPIIRKLRGRLPAQDGVRLDAAQVPNPFAGVGEGTFPDAASALLTLVDGGEDGEVVPLQPLLVRARGVDTIIAIDASGDTADNFADGSSLIATEQRVALLSPAYAFPRVPRTPAAFAAQNLTRRPAFFGCKSAAGAGAGDPLVVYLANGGPPLGQAPVTNGTGDTLSYGARAVQAFLDQVFDLATQGIPVAAAAAGDTAGGGEGAGVGKDPEWPVCLACAVVDRARRGLGIDRKGACERCLDRYCYS
ncbi:lysophospholipase [Trametes elegans]|nr:lysophospholipase [Trametes elegans]